MGPQAKCALIKIVHENAKVTKVRKYYFVVQAILSYFAPVTKVYKPRIAVLQLHIEM